MAKGKHECYQWAKMQSNFDPMAPSTATPPPADQAQKGGVARGVLGGGPLVLQ